MSLPNIASASALLIPCSTPFRSSRTFPSCGRRVQSGVGQTEDEHPFSSVWCADFLR